jgi:hypothetical protein
MPKRGENPVREKAMFQSFSRYPPGRILARFFNREDDSAELGFELRLERSLVDPADIPKAQDHEARAGLGDGSHFF